MLDRVQSMTSIYISPKQKLYTCFSMKKNLRI